VEVAVEVTLSQSSSPPLIGTVNKEICIFSNGKMVTVTKTTIRKPDGSVETTETMQENQGYPQMIDRNP
jgi:hypothetical protein